MSDARVRGSVAAEEEHISPILPGKIHNTPCTPDLRRHPEKGGILPTKGDARPQFPLLTGG